MTVRAKKHLGQHFLKDEDTAKNIANSLTESWIQYYPRNWARNGDVNQIFIRKKSKNHCHGN